MEAPSARTLPRAIMAIESPKISASSILCVVKTITRPLLAASIASHTCLRDIGSIPVVGSSRYTTRGSPSSESATDKRRLIPPLYAPVRTWAASVNFTDSSNSAACSFTSFLLSPLILPYIFMCSMPVSSFHKTSNCGQTPMVDRILSRPPVATMDSPRTSASPPVGGSTPVKQLIVVVLPAPLGPNKQKILFSLILNQEPLIAQKSSAFLDFFFFLFFLRRHDIFAHIAARIERGNIFCKPNT
mmetsp:Transcript_13306/g.26522  ORF Transcript_13306/g.26522 Transcript_13306/m.26522 type:complete len:244 (-) Transcript_13306:1554-2285(-)